MALDARKSLAVLHDEWRSCTRCDLGQRRDAVGGNFVAGEGATRGIMFIGEGPGVNEEEFGRPFIGQSGSFLRDALKKLGFDDFYLTNTVTCRSCEPQLDAAGQPVMRARRGRPPEIAYNDRTPLGLHVEACRPRLYEEIYLVDPVLIVALGGAAAEALMQRPVAITRERGTPEEIEIPGATFRPVLTDKRQAWARKVRGELVAPVERNTVRYLVLPTIHPAFVLKKGFDKGDDSPARKFSEDIRLAVKIYERYLAEATGRAPVSYDHIDLEVNVEEES